MPDISDTIIREAAQGDVNAFEEIYKAYSGLVYSVAYRMVRHQENAEEVTQEVFLTVYRKLNTFAFKSSLKTWIYRMAINTTINYAKKTNKENNRTVEFNEEFSWVDPSNDVEREVDKQFNERVVASLLNTLNPDQRACIVLRNIEGLSYQEIAEVLNININTVRTRLKRARETLLLLRNEVMNNAM